MNIFKHDPIEGRPFFTDQAEKADRPVESILTQNPLLNRLKPVKHPSRVALFFRRFWAQISQYFGVKHPDSIKEELKNLVRPIESDTSNLTVGNLWHHYEHFLSEDKKCPPGLKKCFDKMEHDEKEILKLSRLREEKQDKAKAKFIKKTIKSVQRMEVGSSRLFLLNRQMSTDQSLSGDLFCTINRTKDGYVLNFTGSGENMDALQKGFPLAGKEKAIRTLSFETIDPDEFLQNDFLSDLVTKWVEPQWVAPQDILNSTQTFTPKASSSLDDYNTKSNRPDKLFWNIVLSIPQENTKNNLEATIPASIRSIRLRAELLTLYEAYDEARIDLDPKKTSFKSLSKLLENVSGKVLLQYRKGYLSDKDFDSISKRLKIMDDHLRTAKQEPNKTIPSSISAEKPAFPDVSLKKVRIEPPQVISILPVVDNISSRSIETFENEKLEVTLDDPIPLQTHTSITTKDAFLATLDQIYSLRGSMENGTSEEQTFAANEMLRFFHEIPFNNFDNDSDIAKKSLWLTFTKQEDQETLEKLVELTESISSVKNTATITQYDYEALVKLRNMSLFFNALRTNYWFGVPMEMAMSNNSRLYNRRAIPLENRLLLSRAMKYFSEAHIPSDSFLLYKKLHFQAPRYRADSYELILRQQNVLITLLKLEPVLGNSESFTDVKPDNDGTFKHWIRPIHNAFLAGLYKNAISDNYNRRAVPETFFDTPEETVRHFMDDEEGATDENSSLPGIPNELKALSRLLRDEKNHTEFLSFIQEHSSLLYNHDIRNFFDALFFRMPLEKTIRSSGDYQTGASIYPEVLGYDDRMLFEKTIQTSGNDRMVTSIYPEVIGSEAAKIQNGITEQLNSDKVEDPELLIKRFEMLLYYNEMLIRIKQEFIDHGIPTDDFPHLETKLEELCTLCKTTPELNASLGYASRILLRAQLENGTVEPGNLAKILNTYADIHTSSIAPTNIEPAFEQEMKLHWQKISTHLKSVDPKSFIPLLNRLCVNNGAPLDDSEWTSMGELVFQNDQVEVDLKTWKVSLRQASTQFVKFPLSIMQDPFIKTLLSDKELQSLNVLKRDINGVAAYFFLDKSGVPIQIEDKGGVYTFYKEFDFNGTKTWLQCFDLTPKPKVITYEDINLFSAFSLYKDALAQMSLRNSSISLFNNVNLFIDPSNKKTGYIIDSTGEITFRVKLKQVSKNLTIDKVWDYRELPHTGPWEIHNASLLENNSLNFLKCLENKNEIVLFARKGKLKKVELPRYGLKFDLEDGKLLCKTEPFKGYFLDSNKNDFDLYHALVLEHPIKGKKLLLGDTDALKSSTKKLSPKARGLGAILLAFHYLDIASDLTRGILPKAIQRGVSRFDSTREKLHFTAFDLRAITGEICQTGSTPPNDLLNLIKHEIIAGHPLVAASLIKDYPLKAVIANPKLLAELIKFCNSESATGAEVAIKLKFVLNISKALSDNRRLRDNIKVRLEQIAVKNGKIVMASGRRVPT